MKNVPLNKHTKGVEKATASYLKRITSYHDNHPFVSLKTLTRAY